ncbi:MAG: methyl-accepting chemotaxis protein, partial [Eubacterium sp.]|nr:methyl-accepting chemotaxis protein [Eubacterium sp.]
MKNTSMKKRLTWVFGIIDFFILSIIGASLYMVYSLDNVPQDRLTRFTVYMILTAVVTVIIMTFFTTTILHSLRVSVAELKRVSDEVAIGNVDVEIKKYGNDEFGYLSDEYQVLINNIKEQAEVIEEVAQGNLTVNVRVKSESDLMGNSLKKLVNDTHYALSNIHDAADQVLVSSSEVAGASEALAQGSTEQASAIEEITASIDEIAEKTKVNAQEADSAAELMKQA